MKMPREIRPSMKWFLLVLVLYILMMMMSMQFDENSIKGDQMLYEVIPVGDRYVPV